MSGISLRVSVRVTHSQISTSLITNLSIKVRSAQGCAFIDAVSSEGIKKKQHLYPAFCHRLAASVPQGTGWVGEGPTPTTLCLKWILVLFYQYWCERSKEDNRKDKTYFGFITFWDRSPGFHSSIWEVGPGKKVGQHSLGGWLSCMEVQQIWGSSC
jgi:hypothetical protein